MELWTRFVSTWREASTGWRVALGAVVVVKVILIISWLTRGEPIRALLSVATLVVLVWLVGIARDSAAPRRDVSNERTR